MQQDLRSVLIRSTSGISEPRFNAANHFLVDLQTYVAQIVWARTATELQEVETENRWVYRLASGYGMGLRGYLRHFGFVFFIFRSLKVIHPKIIYSCDAETLLPAVIWGRLSSCIIIYDQFDPISMKSKNSFFGIFLDLMESFLVLFVDFRVTANISRVKKSQKSKWIELKNLFQINMSTLDLNYWIQPKKIFYGGVLLPDRGLREVAEIINSIEGWEFDIFGHGPEFAELKKLASRNVRLYNSVPHSDLMSQARHANIYLAFYDPKFSHNRNTASNKLYEASQLGIPLLTNNEIELGSIVKNHSLGWVIDFADYNQILDVLRNFQKMNISELENIRQNLQDFYQVEKVQQEKLRQDLKNQILISLEN